MLTLAHAARCCVQVARLPEVAAQHTTGPADILVGRAAGAAGRHVGRSQDVAWVGGGAGCNMRSGTTLRSKLYVVDVPCSR